MDSDRFDERHPELVRQLKRDMADEMQSQTGGGYVPGYYADLAGPFVSIAIHFAEAAARAERDGRTDSTIAADAWAEGVRDAIDTLGDADKLRNPYREEED